MAELKIAPIERILKKAGAERVSKEAKVTLRDILEEIAYSIAKAAVEIAKHSGRKTVTAEDIVVAYRTKG